MSGQARGSPGPPADRARITPYEIVFAQGDFEDAVFPGIRREAEQEGIDPSFSERFAFFSTAGDVLRQVVPRDAPPEALEQYRKLLFHSFNFWRYGQPVYLLEPPVARYLVEAAPSLPGDQLPLPKPAFYLQLPPNLFWASVTPNSTPEPVDGFFVTAADSVDAFGRPFRKLELLMVLGIRRARAGFSVIAFDAEVVPEILAEWTESPAREGGKDFENVLPGGEISTLYSILTAGEALKLVARALAYIDLHPDDLVREQPAASPPEERSELRLSRLPHYRVTLGEHASDEAEEPEG